MDNKYDKVLIVDDDSMIVRILSTIISSAGYSVAQAGNGEQALEAIEDDCPHFLITDWEMPGMDGLELCKRIRLLDLPHYVYIIFVTGRCGAEDLITGLESGADDFLAKPTKKAELLARMRCGGRALEREDRLATLAHTDMLTSLPTRRVFEDAMSREWHRAERYDLPLSCVLFDIDFFKKINDVHGHPSGDAVLRKIAAIFSDSSRKSDFICRYGGEEFCAVLPETNEQQAALWAEGVRKRIVDTAFSLEDGETISVSASFGVAQMIADMKSHAELLEIADQCLLSAKQMGRDRVVRFRDIYDGANGVEKQRKSIFDGVRAKDVMSSVVMSLDEQTTIAQATRYLLECRISSAPVVDANNQLIGIVSEKDFLSVADRPYTSNRTVKDVMRTNVVSYDEQTEIACIYEFLCRVTIRNVIIVRDGVPTGFIGRGSVLRWIENANGGMEDSIEHHHAERVPDAPHKSVTINRAAEMLLQQAMQLRNAVADPDDSEQLAYIVGGVSRMQELINDLLAASGHANRVEAATVASSSSA